MLPDRVSNPGSLVYESGALPIALCGPAQGTAKGKRKRGSQKTRWEDNIKEWTRMDFASSTMVAENRSRWKGIVLNSSVVPRRTPKVMG